MAPGTLPGGGGLPSHWWGKVGPVRTVKQRATPQEVGPRTMPLVG